MKNVRKGLAMAISMMLTVGVLSGCGGSKNKTVTKQSGKKDTVVVWTYPQYKADPAMNLKGYDDLLQRLIEKYRKTHPNVEVKYEVLSWSEGDQKFDIALNAGTPPDIYYTTSQAKYVKTGLAIPLDKYLTDKDKSDFVPFALNRFKIDKKQYGLPTWISTHCLAGEKTYFEDAGVDYKTIMEKGWTWEEFEQDLKKIADVEKAKSGKKVYGFITEGKKNEMFRHFMLANGLGTGISKDGKFTFKGDGVVETLNYFKKLMDEGIMPKETAGIDDQKCQDMFNEGQGVVFGRVGPYQLNFNNNRNMSIEQGKTKGEKREIVLLPFPHGKNGKNVVYGDCGGYMAFKQKKSKGAEHEQNVADLIKTLTSADHAEACTHLFTTPARKSGQEVIKGKIKATDENLKFMGSVGDIIQSRPILDPKIDSKFSKVDKEAILPLWQAFLAGEKAPKDVENGMNDKVKEVFGD